MTQLVRSVSYKYILFYQYIILLTHFDLIFICRSLSIFVLLPIYTLLCFLIKDVFSLLRCCPFLFSFTFACLFSQLPSHFCSFSFACLFFHFLSLFRPFDFAFSLLQKDKTILYIYAIQGSCFLSFLGWQAVGEVWMDFLKKGKLMSVIFCREFCHQRLKL